MSQTVALHTPIALIIFNPAPLWADILVYLALAATVISGFDYFFGLRKRIEEQRLKEKANREERLAEDSAEIDLVSDNR